MCPFTETIPAEEKQSHKGGLQKKGHQSFDGQRGPEDIPHIMRIVGPIGSELKFQGKAGGNSQGKVNTEQFTPETGHVLINLHAGHDIDRLHDKQYP